MAAVHENYIKEFLELHKGEAFIAEKLVTELKQMFPDLQDSNCRRIISNAHKHGRIASSEPITFAHNQYAYFSSSEVFGYKVLAKCIMEYKKPLHRVIFALQRGNGILSVLDARKISGTTLLRESHSLLFENILDQLEILKIAEVRKIGDTDFIIKCNKNVDTLQADGIRTDLQSNNTMLSLVLQWAVRANIIDDKQLCFMGEANSFNGVERNNEIWDAFGFSNAVGLGGITRDFQTLVLVDFHAKNIYEEYDFAGFKDRVDRVVYSTRGERRKVLPIVFSNGASPLAIASMKKYGYINFNIADILGRNAVGISRNFTENRQLIEQKLAVNDFTVTDKVADSLEQIKKSGCEANYGNLKGALFEYLMYPVVQKIYGHNSVVIHSYKGSCDGKEFECDYLVKAADENVIFELKGYAKGNKILLGEFDKDTGKYTDNSVRWFLNHTFELCSKVLGKHPVNKFCYITTSDFSEDAAKELISRKKNKPNKLECCYNHDSLLELLKENNMKDEIKVINQFYS